MGFTRAVMKSRLTWVGRVQELSEVLRRARPVLGFWLISAAHTSPGDRNSVKSNTSSEFDAPRKRTFSALPFTLSVLTMFSSVALPSCAVKYGTTRMWPMLVGVTTSGPPNGVSWADAVVAKPANKVVTPRARMLFFMVWFLG